MNTPITVAIAGSTDRTRICASAIFADDRFKITGVITPTPKPSGRKQIVQPNPLHIFAIAHEKPLVVIENGIDDEFHDRVIRVIGTPDILLVVDFGFIIPQWMLGLPTIAPVNIHPSALPKYRGSSPGQFALLFGEKESATTIMVMDEQMDHGPIISRLPFAIDPTWRAPEFYEHAFSQIHEKLTAVLMDFVEKKIIATPQPDAPLTPTARQLKREDGCIPFEVLQDLLQTENSKKTVPFLDAYHLPTTREQLFNMWRALYPWPGVWTIKDGKRVKLLTFHLEGEKLCLDEIQFEGKNAEAFRGF